MKCAFSQLIFENPQILNFMKFHPVGSELFHAEWQTNGQTDTHGEAEFLFAIFANVPKQGFVLTGGLKTFTSPLGKMAFLKFEVDTSYV
jgi:hypothetical protein